MRRSNSGHPWRRGGLIVTVASLLVGAMVGSQSSPALLVLLLDGVPAFGLLAAAALGGLWLAAALGQGRRPLRWQLMLGAALGIGALSLLVLGLGLLGWLAAGLWYGILAIAAAAGMIRLVVLLRREEAARAESACLRATHRQAGLVPRPPAGLSVCDAQAGGTAAAGRWRWLWLTVCPFAALGILVASVPPGLLWAEEGLGFDVLEYHLEMPREYLDAGRITYAPHNVYANFPANAEMLYLLCMILKGDAVQGAATAKMLNLGLAGLVVATGWLIGRERSPVAGVVTGVVTGSLGWLTYLSGVAYVENAMLFFGLTALAALVRVASESDAAGVPKRTQAAATTGNSTTTRAAGVSPRGRSRGEAARPPSHCLRWLIVAGLLAGLASGCKYTGVVLIALPLTIIVIGLPSLSVRQRLAGIVAYGSAAVLTVSPWLLKNMAMTHNPVFPLAGGVFTNYPPGWGAEQAEHFAASHALGPGERSLPARLGLLWRRVPGDPQQRVGPLLILLALAGLFAGARGRLEVLCGLTLGSQVLIWLLATHLYARFAVVFLLPLVVLASRAVQSNGRAILRWGIAGVAVVGALFNAGFAARLYAQHLYVDRAKLPIEGIPEVFTQGKLRGYEWLGPINSELPDNARLLLVGEARAFYVQREVNYCVVFNRSPFVEAVRSARTGADVVRWLQRKGYTHVLVNWREIRRLRRSRYGFPEEITPDRFRRLTAAGLVHVKTITDSFDGAPYADLFRVVWRRSNPPGHPR